MNWVDFVEVANMVDSGYQFIRLGSMLIIYETRSHLALWVPIDSFQAYVVLVLA